MVQEVTLKNTKNDILDAYHAALKEIKTLKERSAKEIQQANQQEAIVKVGGAFCSVHVVLGAAGAMSMSAEWLLMSTKA